VYFLLNHPLHKPDPSKFINEGGEFHCLFKANFDNHSLLYRAKIDGIFSQQSITDTLVEKLF